VHAVERFAREDVRQVMREFGVSSCRRAVTTDPTEEVFLLSAEVLAAVDVDVLTRALMEVLPRTKVWVVEDSSRWSTEQV
jgi:hypothetical protein